jgi:hypothetical protein
MNIRISSGAMRRTLRAAVVGAAALLAAFAVPSSARAVSVDTTLDTLVAGGSNAAGIVLGDKRYSNFTFSSSGDAPVTAGAVGVVLSTDDNNRYNLRFSFSRDALAATAGQTTDAVISYQVDVLGGQRINGVGLAFESSVGQGQSPGTAAASVTETVSSVDGSDVSPGGLVQDTEIITVFNDGAGGLGDTPSTLLAVNPTASLKFSKDILVSSRPEGGRVVISTVDNFVNQVPEPGSITLLAAAGGALLLRRRRTA